MAQCPICGAPVPGAENHACENCRRASYTAYTDTQGRTVYATQPPPQPQKPQPFRVPVTRLLLALNIAVFVLMLASGVPVMGPPQTKEGAQLLYRWGAEYGPAVMQGQYWRLFTEMFLHDGLIHIALNMWSLWQLGRLAERLMGGDGYLALYILSGIAGNILSIAMNPYVLAVGASGAIFGIAGALIAILMRVRLNAPPEQVRSLRNNLIVVVVVNLVVLGRLAHIDNMAHLGGVLSGFLIALLLAPSMNISPDAYRRARSIVFPFATATLVVAFILVRHWRLAWLAHHPQ